MSTERIRAFLEEKQPATPCLVIDLDAVADGYRRVRDALAPARVLYAVKANPAPEVVRVLAAEGAGFDVASPGEIDLALDAGVRPDTLSYGNTIKKPADITRAYESGVRRFTFDSESDCDTLAERAPRSGVWCRILVDVPGAQTPFGRKFGCSPDLAVRLLRRAADAGLDVEGVAFHVGSQHVDPAAWEAGIASAATVSAELARHGVEIKSVNLGGGFPTRYRDDVPPLARYGEVIGSSVRRHFGRTPPELYVEPGRAIVADAGLIRSEVVLVSRKSDVDSHRWVYLDIGRYQGLAETEAEMIAYRLSTAHDGTADGPVIIAGPTCDGDDVLYQRTPYRLPLALRTGDHLDILSAGAYTASYASVSFNGFPPLATHVVGESR
ncbi:ornithine decarboxylase [Herbihabitans rhizosphaerae]|uniref:ornithine decarboxylase n=1 Tax=Herbihabitans rhizosphaerae TaxID=1872711 RepID=A0A4Q7KG89_9PSEU|nr:type III PLP-dependent enzyme [Herbihabitans rhizosphaerae]RZS34252.1 ornithine decarboxylase [Herbihabitans rhizosphaerae]